MHPFWNASTLGTFVLPYRLTVTCKSSISAPWRSCSWLDSLTWRICAFRTSLCLIWTSDAECCDWTEQTERTGRDVHEWGGNKTIDPLWSCFPQEILPPHLSDCLLICLIDSTIRSGGRGLYRGVLTTRMPVVSQRKVWMATYCLNVGG